MNLNISEETKKKASRILNLIATFPVWYFFRSIPVWFKADTHIFLFIFDLLGLGPILKHLLAPFRRDRTLAGYMVGIVIRLVWSAMSIAILGIVMVVALSITSLYYLAPLAIYVFFGAYYLIPYFLAWFGIYVYMVIKDEYWLKVTTGILTPELATRVWKRLELDPKEAAEIYAKSKELFIQYLREHSLNEDDFLFTKTWVMRREYQKQAWKFWRDEFFVRRKGVNVGWVAGFLPELKQFSVDITAEAAVGHLPHIYGREKELEAILRVVRRPGQNNVLLVGEAGVGKTSMVYALAWQILGRRVEGDLAILQDLVRPLSGKRIIELHAAGLMGGTAGRGALEERLNLITHELAEGETILFVNQLEILMEAGLIGYLTPILSSTRFPIIATTTPEVFRTQLAKLPEMVSELEVINIMPPSVGETIRILQGVVKDVEIKYGVIFTYPALRGAAELSERYIHNEVLPDKAIKVLAKAAEMSINKTITLEIVQETVSQISNVPVGALTGEETTKLLNLEQLLQAKIIGQNSAVREVARAIRRARTGVGSNDRPIASLLFVGPTGTGKTLTSKTLAQVYFTPESSAITSEVELTQLIDRSFIRFDMSEFSEFGSVEHFIQRMTQEVTDKPFALVLLDEFEKAEGGIHNLFLQIFEDGRLTDDSGRTVDFRNTILIATSNAVISIPDGVDESSYIQTELLKAFRPELVNRFDGIVMFHPITMTDMNQIVGLELGNLARRMKDSREIDLTWTPQLAQELARLGFDPQYGARPLRRVIQDYIEDALAQKLLRKELQSGDTYELNINILQGN